MSNPNLFVRTTYANGEVRYWLISGEVTVVEFSKRIQRIAPVKSVEYIEAHELPATVNELHPVEVAP